MKYSTSQQHVPFAETTSEGPTASGLPSWTQEPERNADPVCIRTPTNTAIRVRNLPRETRYRSGSLLQPRSRHESTALRISVGTSVKRVSPKRSRTVCGRVSLFALMNSLKPRRALQLRRANHSGYARRTVRCSDARVQIPVRLITDRTWNLNTRLSRSPRFDKPRSLPQPSKLECFHQQTRVSGSPDARDCRPGQSR